MVDCSRFMGPFLSILRMLYVRIGSIRLQNVLVSAGIRKRSGSRKKLTMDIVMFGVVFSSYFFVDNHKSNECTVGDGLFPFSDLSS